MSSDFKMFMIAPKFVAAIGQTITATTLRAFIPGQKYKTILLWAIFGDVLISAGRLSRTLDNLAGMTLKAGCYVTVDIDNGVAFVASPSPVLILFVHD